MKLKILFVVVAWVVIAVVALSDKAKAEKYRIQGSDLTFENPSPELIVKIKEFQVLLTELITYAVKPSAVEDSKQAKMHICTNDSQVACVEVSIEKVDIDKTITNKTLEVKAAEVEPVATPTPKTK